MIAQSVHIQNAGKKNYQLSNFAGYFASLIFTRTFYSQVLILQKLGGWKLYTCMTLAMKTRKITLDYW